MKLRLLTVGLVTCLTFGLSYSEASATSELSTTCGNVQINTNPTFQQMNCLLTNAAIKADIPPEVVKAVATQENGGWKQFEENGEPIISSDGGIGLMQITNKDHLNQEKLKYDIYYNIEEGIKILSSMYDRKDLPKIKGAGREVIENWYFPIMAYNGTKPVNSPLYSLTGKKNTNAYQEKIFAHIEQQNYTILGVYPFKTNDFEYDRTNSDNIVFNKKEYTLTDQMHTSTQLFSKGEKVIVTQDNVNLRKAIETSTGAQKLSKNTTLIIDGPLQYDNNNYFVWYPVTTADSKLTGYISSAYISKKITATVRTITDHDTSVSGTAPANSTIQIMNGSKMIGSTTTNASGKFIAKINKQKAKTKLTVTIKDSLNTPIPSITKTVIDKTAPKKPTISTIRKTTKIVTGKTEPGATVELKFGSGTKIYRDTANKSGAFKITIKPQKTGTNVYITVRDAANNTCKTKTKVK